MAGYTGFSIGFVRNATAFIPVRTLIEAGINSVSMLSRTYQRYMEQSRGKFIVNEENIDKAKEFVLNSETEKKNTWNKIFARIQKEATMITS